MKKENPVPGASEGKEYVKKKRRLTPTSIPSKRGEEEKLGTSNLYIEKENNKRKKGLMAFQRGKITPKGRGKRIEEESIIRR